MLFSTHPMQERYFSSLLLAQAAKEPYYEERSFWAKKVASTRLFHHSSKFEIRTRQSLSFEAHFCFCLFTLFFLPLLPHLYISSPCFATQVIARITLNINLLLGNFKLLNWVFKTKIVYNIILKAFKVFIIKINTKFKSVGKYS